MKEKNLRRDRIEAKLTEIIDAINLVADNLPKDYEDFATVGLVKDGIYKKLEFAIENIIDILNIINSDLRLGIPEVEEDIIDNIKKAKILDDKVIELIKEMKKFRNVLIHKYGEINDEQAYENIKKGLEDFSAITNEIEDFLKKNKLKKVKLKKMEKVKKKKKT